MDLISLRLSVMLSAIEVSVRVGRKEIISSYLSVRVLGSIT